MAYATVEQVSHVLNLSPRRIHQLVKEEGMPRVSRGEYEMVKCVQWYIRFLRDQLEAAKHGTETEAQARLRLLQVTADLRRLDLDERTSELIRIEDVMNMITPVLVGVRMRLMAVPRRAAQIITGITKHHEIVELLDGYIREVLINIANLPVELESIKNKKKRRTAQDLDDMRNEEDETTDLMMNDRTKRKKKFDRKRKRILKKKKGIQEELASSPPSDSKTSDPAPI